MDAQSRGRADEIDPADQWVLNPRTGNYELRLEQSAPQAPPSQRHVPSPASRRAPRPAPASPAVPGPRRPGGTPPGEAGRRGGGPRPGG
ncbi:LytR family transcriptional regulator, partial [Streptomyces sp. NPDC006544]